MAKKRVHEIAKARGLTSKEVLAKLQDAGVDVTAAASSVEEAVAAKVLDDGAPAANPADAPPEDAAPKRAPAPADASSRASPTRCRRSCS